MTAELLTTSGPVSARRSPLAHRTAELKAAGGPGLSLQELAFPTVLNLRLDPDSELAAQLGLPGAGLAKPLEQAPGGWEALWLGPDEWLLTSSEELASDLPAWLTPRLSGLRPAALVDLSANYAGLAIAGEHARDLLEKAITLDLHPRSFTVGSCAQTTFARGQVLLRQVQPQGYHLLFRPSFGTYFTDWLIDAAQEFR